MTMSEQEVDMISLAEGQKLMEQWYADTLFDIEYADGEIPEEEPEDDDED